MPNDLEILADKKTSPKHLENLSSKDGIESVGCNGCHEDDESTQQILRKLDRRILPWMAGLFLMSFLDRSNIGNARLDGLEKDLGLRGLQFNNALAIFYPFYIIAEVPSNVMLKRTRPSLWFTLIMVSWGVVMTLMGLVKNYQGLLAARSVLGFAEGGLFPGIAFYITLWYRRSETGTRLALIYGTATVAGAFGGLLARGITEMRGVGGLKGWAWIFVLEGLLTIVVASTAYFFVPDHPTTAKFLTPSQRVTLVRRLQEDTGGLSQDFNISYVWDAVKDWKTYAYMLIFIACTTPTYSMSLFLPTIIKNMGYTAEKAQLLSVPPYILACTLTVIAGIAADRLGTRGRFMIGFFLLAIVGFTMLIASVKPAVQYAAVFVAAAGTFPTNAMCMAWCGNNIGGATKKSVAIAIIVAFGNFGGLIASYTYIAANAPRYYSGHGILLAILLMGAVVAFVLHVYFRRENLRRDKTYKPPTEYTEAQMATESHRGDQASFFRFID
ncbi:major facilitator superfamily transporter [Ceratobasidium sp. AG-Ba]|nr:major facilitator superfamily transporter [Ceratobasidium sp. AG-Ba]